MSLSSRHSTSPLTWCLAALVAGACGSPVTEPMAQDALATDAAPLDVTEPSAEDNGGGASPRSSGEDAERPPRDRPRAGDGESGDACVLPECPPTDDSSVPVDSSTAESDACIGPECDITCGPLEVAKDGACVCDDTLCRASWSGECVPQWVEQEFSNIENLQVPLLVPRRPDLLAHYLDLDLVHSRINDEIAKVSALVGTDDWMWQAAGYQLFSSPLCSMFQFSATGWSPDDVESILDGVRTEPDTDAYMSLSLGTILSDRADQCALWGVANSFHVEMTAYLEQGVDPVPLKGSLTRYLFTMDLHDAQFADELVASIRTALYPDSKITVQGVWDSELIFDLVLAAYLDLEFDAEAVIAALDSWWQPHGGVELVGCDGDQCLLKGLHQVVLIDAIHDIVPEDKLVQIASIFFSNIGANGSLGFPALLGLPPSTLWSPTSCDIFCSAKHWHIGLAMNHLATKLQHREDDIKTGAAMLGINQEWDTTPGDLPTAPDCLVGGQLHCSADQYCRPEGCGDGLAGTCTAKPLTCPPGDDSVCACDGITYASSCLAQQAGQFVIGPGSCPQAAVTCDVEATIWGAGTGCPLDAYCFGGCVGAGFCKQRPLCGSEPMTLKCGCNGLTYGNSCTLASAGQNLAHEGWCTPPENPVDLEPCGSEMLIECSDPSMACDPQSCELNAEGYCLNLGQPQPGAAEAIYCTPFPAECGCDNLTYSNQCGRVEAGVALQHPGPCGDEGGAAD